MPPSGSGEGRVMTVHHDAELDAGGRYDAGPEGRGLRMERPGVVEIGRLTPARMPCEARKREAGSGGRSKCMSGRQSVRTRRRVDKSDNSWGHAASRKVHPRAERRASSRFCGDPEGPFSLRDRVIRKETHCRA